MISIYLCIEIKITKNADMYFDCDMLFDGVGGQDLIRMCVCLYMF